MRFGPIFEHAVSSDRMKSARRISQLNVVNRQSCRICLKELASMSFSRLGPSLLKCSIVAPEAPIACGYCFIKIPQYTQVLSLARISCSSCLEIPYVLDMVLGDLYMRHFELARTQNTILWGYALSPTPDKTGFSVSAIRTGQCSATRDRKSTRLNSSHRCISYAVFCLKKKK